MTDRRPTVCKQDVDEFSLTLGGHLRQLQEYISMWAQSHRQLFDETVMWQAEAEESLLQPHPAVFQARPGKLTCRDQQDADQPTTDPAVNGHQEHVILMRLLPQHVPNDEVFPLCNELLDGRLEQNLTKADSDRSDEDQTRLAAASKYGLDVRSPIEAEAELETVSVLPTGQDAKNGKLERSSVSRKEPRRSGRSGRSGNDSYSDGGESHAVDVRGQIKKLLSKAELSSDSGRGGRPDRSVMQALVGALIHTSTSSQSITGRSKNPTKRLVQHKAFEMCSATVIIVNACMLGYAADYSMKHLDQPSFELEFLQLLEIIFTTFYTLEIALRIYADGHQYFVGDDMAWNGFETSLVILGILDLAMQHLQNVSCLRAIRLMKPLKLLRIVRLMRIFKDLRMILYSLHGCMKAMLWMCTFIALISYMFAVFFLQGCIEHLTDDHSTVSSSAAEEIKMYWGSIGSAMGSMFLSTTSGVDWYLVAEPLKKVGFLHHLVFYVYIGFFTFVLLNTLTSVFVEASLQHADRDYQMIIDNELQKKDMYISKLKAWFDEIDTEGTGEISYDAFCSKINDPRMLAFAASLEMDVFNAKQFFYMISNQGNATLDLATFVVGCIKLKGTSKAIDLQVLMHAHKKGLSEQHKVNAEIRHSLAKLEKYLSCGVSAQV